MNKTQRSLKNNLKLYKRDYLTSQLDKKLFDEEGKEITEATLTFVGELHGIPLYTNPTVPQGEILFVDESRLQKVKVS